MSANDLTNLADCKTWLGLTSTTDDALVGVLITAVSQAILADLGRSSVLPMTYMETFDGGGEAALPLRHWPVTGLLACTADGVSLPVSTMPGQSGVVLDAVDPSPPGAMQRLSYRAGVFPSGVQNIVVTYRAGYEIVAEKAFVPAVAPFTVAVSAPFGAWQIDTGVSGASGSYTATAGIYTFSAAAAGAAVSLSYGFIPADLARAACEWVAERYVSRTRVGQSAKTLGGQETTSFIVKAMPDLVSRLLQPYRRVAR